MSGPVVPPLEVSDEADGGSVSGRPITVLEVTDGTLSISGKIATLDTSGSSTTPGGATSNVQYNNAGAFGGAADFTFTGIGGTDPTLTITNSASDAATITQKTLTFDGGTALPMITTTSGDDGLILATGSEGITGPSLHLDTVTSPSQALLQNQTTDGTVTIQTTAGTGDITIVSVNDIDLKVSGSNVVEIQNSTSDTDSVLSILGNGTGDAKLDLQNASNRVWVLCDENKKLKVQGGSGGDTFIFDVSSASGGITFPDSTVQTTAASGGGGGFTPPGIPSGNSDVYQEWLGWSNGLQSLVGSTRVVAYQWANASTRIRPHFISKAGDLDTAYIDCSSAPTDAGTQTCTIGAYKAGTDNSVGDLKATATLSVSASGIVSAAWVAEAGEDLAVTAGELLWVGFHSTYGSSGTAAGFSMSEGSVNSQIGADFDASPQGVTAWYPSSTGAFPEPFTLGTVAGDSAHWLYMMSSIS